MEQVEQDPDFIALSRQFKATAMELISVLEQVRVISLDYILLIFIDWMNRLTSVSLGYGKLFCKMQQFS